MKQYMFIATFKVVEKNSVRYAEIPIRIDIRHGNYDVAFSIALDEARSMRSTFKILIGIKFVE